MLERIKMAFFELEDWQIDYLKKIFKGIKYKLSFFKEPLNSISASKIKDVQIIGIFIYSIVDKKLLDSLPKLKMVCTFSSGFDHIDVKECHHRNITVCNVPFYGENTVAEHTFALILALSRKIFPSIERTKKGDFKLDGLRGFDLKGKTLGLIGTGHISAHVARIAYGFEMKIVGYDMHPDHELEEKFGLRYLSINDVLKNSDIISLHLPLNDGTKHIINKKNISLLKPTALLINTARGGLIETDALVNVLKNARIAGAGLDVLEEENCIKEDTQLLSKEFDKSCDLRTVVANHILLKMDNVIVTPHNAFNSAEALQRIMDTSIENIKNHLKNTPSNVVK
jgi:D-lactate dehydrogenase